MNIKSSWHYLGGGVGEGKAVCLAMNNPCLKRDFIFHSEWWLSGKTPGFSLFLSSLLLFKIFFLSCTILGHA